MVAVSMKLHIHLYEHVLHRDHIDREMYMTFDESELDFDSLQSIYLSSPSMVWRKLCHYLLKWKGTNEIITLRITYGLIEGIKAIWGHPKGEGETEWFRKSSSRLVLISIDNDEIADFSHLPPQFPDAEFTFTKELGQ
jgi:hypothetical protein